MSCGCWSQWAGQEQDWAAACPEAQGRSHGPESRAHRSGLLPTLHTGSLLHGPPSSGAASLSATPPRKLFQAWGGGGRKKVGRGEGVSSPGRCGPAPHVAVSSRVFARLPDIVCLLRPQLRHRRVTGTRSSVPPACAQPPGLRSHVVACSSPTQGVARPRGPQRIRDLSLPLPRDAGCRGVRGRLGAGAQDVHMADTHPLL